jgi:hypothetical protein
MNTRNQPDRWEATLLAVVLAIAGAPFLFATLGSLMRPNIFTSLAIHNAAPILLAVVGSILLIADRGADSADTGQQNQVGDRHGL